MVAIQEKFERKIERNIFKDNYNLDLIYNSEDVKEIEYFYHTYFDNKPFLELRKTVVYYLENLGWQSQRLLMSSPFGLINSLIILMNTYYFLNH